MILLSCVVVVHDRDKTVITIVSRPNNLEDHHQHSLSQDHINQTWIKLFLDISATLSLPCNLIFYFIILVRYVWLIEKHLCLTECKSLFFVIMMWKYIFECKIILMLLVYIGLKLGVLCKSKRLNKDIYSLRSFFMH